MIFMTYLMFKGNVLMDMLKIKIYTKFVIHA